MLDSNKIWAGAVRIIGLSIDQDKESLTKHVNEKGWTRVEHYWVGQPGCTVSDDWHVTGVPHCILVDKNGNIAWIGHPATLNIEDAIKKLINGETI